MRKMKWKDWNISKRRRLKWKWQGRKLFRQPRGKEERTNCWFRKSKLSQISGYSS